MENKQPPLDTMDDVMVAFADDEDGLAPMIGGEEGDDMEESETRLPNLAGLVLKRYEDVDLEQKEQTPAAAVVASQKTETRIVPICGASYPTDFVGDEQKEMELARSIVAHALSASANSGGRDSPSAVLASAADATPEKVEKMVSTHTEMHSDTDGPFQSMIASFSMASYGGGGVGVAIQFLESGFAASIVGHGRGDYVLIDPHDRDPETGGMQKGFGNGKPIAIHSNMVIPLSQYLLSAYGRTTPVKYRATFLVPKIPKGKEEEEEEEDDGGVMPMDIPSVTASAAAAAAAYDKYPKHNYELPEEYVAPAAAAAAVTVTAQPPPLPAKDTMTMSVGGDDEEEPSSEGKRKRVQTAAVTVRSESDESDEKKAKTPPPQVTAAAAKSAQQQQQQQKKADSVPTVVVKKTTAASSHQAIKPKSIASSVTVTTEVKAATRSSSAATAAQKTPPPPPPAAAAQTVVTPKGKE